MDRNEACSKALYCTEAGRDHGFDGQHSAPILFQDARLPDGQRASRTSEAHTNLALWVDRKASGMRCGDVLCYFDDDAPSTTRMPRTDCV
jgi:hypothetical protein